MKCAWWVIVGKHAPRPCGAAVAGKREGVPVCKRHLHSNPTAVAAVANTIRRILADFKIVDVEHVEGAESLAEVDRAELLHRLVQALETPL